MDIFVAGYIILVGVLIGYVFIWLCQHCWQVPASIIIVSMFLLMIIFVTPAKGETDFIDVTGDIIDEPEVIDGIEYCIEEVEPGLWLVPVKTTYGVICYYDDNKVQGEVYMLCFGEDFEVIDVIVFDDLEKPFKEEPSGSLLFFIFTRIKCHTVAERRYTMVAIYENGILVDFVKKEDVAEAMAKAAEEK